MNLFVIPSQEDLAGSPKYKFQAFLFSIFCYRHDNILWLSLHFSTFLFARSTAYEKIVKTVIKILAVYPSPLLK